MSRGRMPVMASIKERFEKEKPLDGIRIGACLHVTTETAPDAHPAGRRRSSSVVASNALSTQDDVAAALVEAGIDTFPIKGEEPSLQTHQRGARYPAKITMDDGADMVSVLHKERPTRSPRSSAAPRRRPPA